MSLSWMVKNPISPYEGKEKVIEKYQPLIWIVQKNKTIEYWAF